MTTEVGIERAFQDNLAVCKQFRFPHFFFFFEEDRFIPTVLQCNISSYFIHHKSNGAFRGMLFLCLFYKKPHQTNKINLISICWEGEYKGMEISEIARFSMLTVGLETLLRCWAKYLIQKIHNFHIHNLRTNTTFLCLR